MCTNNLSQHEGFLYYNVKWKIQDPKLYIQDSMHYLKRLRKHITVFILSVSGEIHFLIYTILSSPSFSAITLCALIFRKIIHKVHLKIPWVFPSQGHAVSMY